MSCDQVLFSEMNSGVHQIKCFLLCRVDKLLKWANRLKLVKYYFMALSYDSSERKGKYGIIN